jgi:predicted amidohydrolase YtcJ
MRADLIIRGGRIFTAELSRPFVSAVAVAGERIIAVGADVDARGAGEVIELEGSMATPGFIDAHVHPVTSGLDKLRCHFDEADDSLSAIEAIAAYASANPDLPWVIGAGWSQAWFPKGCPSKELLDRVVPNRPALITNTDGHGAWANSRALEAAGIDSTTSDPPDGRIERHPDGSPQGTLHEGAVRLVERHTPEDTVDDLESGLLRGQAELLGYGVTGWQDANVGEAIQRAYLRVDGDGRLKARVVGAMWWDRHQGLEQLGRLVARREMAGNRFSPTSVKLMVDGVVENFTASMLESYLDGAANETGSHGIDFIDPEELSEIVSRLDAAGFQCHFHAIGDRGVRNALDAIEATQRGNGPSDHRHHIAHIQVVHPDDIPRFAALDVVANAQPLWANNDEYQTELTRPFLGEERSERQYPFASLLESGARLAMGSDWSVSTANVMEEIHVGVTRRWFEGDEPLGPREALDPVAALTAFTLGSAHVNHADNETGSLAVGKQADFAILDRDPLREGCFREVKVVTTIIGGEIVHHAV